MRLTNKTKKKFKFNMKIVIIYIEKLLSIWNKIINIYILQFIVKKPTRFGLVIYLNSKSSSKFYNGA